MISCLSIFVIDIPSLSWMLQETSSQAETLVPNFGSQAHVALTDEQYAVDA